MILILIGIIIGIYSFVDFKKAFIWFLAYQIFVAFGIQLIEIGGTSLPLGLFLSALFLFHFLRKKKYMDPRMKEFPFKIAFILILLSRLFTCFTALGTFTEELTRAMTFSFQSIINIYIAWYVFESKREFRYLYKITTFVMLAACVLGYFEYATQYNIYTNYEKNFLAEGINYYNPESVRGYRVTSVFEHPIGAGMSFGLYFAVTMYILVNKGRRVPYWSIALITALLGVPLVILTKQRSAVLFTVIISVILINFKKKSFYRIVALLAVGALAITPLIKDYINLFISIFNQGAQQEVAGSSFSMRMMQLEACLQLFQMSPLFGIGEKYYNYINTGWIKEILMLESVWLYQIVTHGILGVISYIALAVETTIIVPYRYSFKKLVFLPIGFWAIYTITTIPSFRLHYFYIFIFYLIFEKKNANMQKEMVVCET